MIGQASHWGPGWAVAGLTAVFAVKHFLADFVLQTGWIARGKDCHNTWVAPLLTHVAVHAVATLVIALIVAPHLWWLALVDFGIHFAVDRGKTLLGRWGRWSPHDARYWWLFGFDQLLHQLTNIGIALALVLL